ncbi:MAG: orotidine-5'-phosphate decarboxylase [Chitinophagaceae bacterium]
MGLDTDITKIPAHLQSHPDAIFEFNRQIIDATKDHCVSYKINTAFYEALGVKGWEAMQKTVKYIPDTHFKIADAKRGDIGNTSAQYAKAFFETLNFDAVTVNPYIGKDSVRPFLEYKDKWTILLGLTSNIGAKDFQLQQIVPEGAGYLITDTSLPLMEKRTSYLRFDGNYLYQKVLYDGSRWGTSENLMFVIGATQPHEFATVRQYAPNHFLLIPGVGVQGGDLKSISKIAMIADCGILVNVSRAIIYASEEKDFAEEAKAIAMQYHYEMEQLLDQYQLTVQAP